MSCGKKRMMKWTIRVDDVEGWKNEEWKLVRMYRVWKFGPPHVDMGRQHGSSDAMGRSFVDRVIQETTKGDKTTGTDCHSDLVTFGRSQNYDLPSVDEPTRSRLTLLFAQGKIVTLKRALEMFVEWQECRAGDGMQDGPLERGFISCAPTMCVGSLGCACRRGEAGGGLFLGALCLSYGCKMARTTQTSFCKAFLLMLANVLWSKPRATSLCHVSCFAASSYPPKPARDSADLSPALPDVSQRRRHRDPFTL